MSRLSNRITQFEQRSKRIPAVDLIRGIALITIFVDHFEYVTGHEFLSYVTLHRWGLSDALELFVFVSGFVFGIAYSRSLQAGFMSCQLKAIRRSLHLVAANFLGYVIVLGFALVIASSDSIRAMGLKYGITDPVSALRDLAMLRYQPYCFDVLPLYAAILPLMPALFWLSRRTALVAIVVSLDLYLAAQVFPDLNLHNSDGSGWFYNPFAWQIAFFAGLIASTCGKPLLVRTLCWQTALVSAIFFLGMTYWINSSRMMLADYGLSWIADKHNAGPLRLLHFASLAYPTAWVIRRYPLIAECRISQTASVCGRHSLPVFVIGLVLTFISRFILDAGDPQWLVAGQELMCLLIIVIFASMLDDRKSKSSTGRNVQTA